MRPTLRIAAGALLAVTLAAVALAQPKRGRGRHRPAPPPVVDAGAESPRAEGAQAEGDAGATASADADVPVPAPAAARGESRDGGVRASPLTPAPDEFSHPIDAGAPSIDYDQLIGDIAALRARVGAVSDTLFHSRIAISVRTDSDHGRIGRLVVSLDDGAVYVAPPNFRADDWQPVYAHALAPGRHALTVDVDRKDDRNDGFGNSQRSRFIVEVPRDQELGVQIKISDDSSMGGDFPSDKEGGYDLRVRLKAEAHPVRK